jgi:hypothetical protein
MYGTIVQIYRYKIDYEETDWEYDYETGQTQEVIVTYTEYCISEEHKNEVLNYLQNQNPVVTTLDTVNLEWFDGLEFETYDEALATLNAGQNAWNINQLQLQIKGIQEEIRTTDDVILEHLETSITESTLQDTLQSRSTLRSQILDLKIQIEQLQV